MSPPRETVKKAVRCFSITIALFFLSMLITTTVSAELHVDDDGQEYPNPDFTNIQQAVNNASVNEKVVVHQGKYNSVTIDKEIDLEGKNYPVVDGIVVNADGCVVRGFTVSGSYNGITINSGYNLVTDNILSKNSYGIHVVNGTQNNIHSNILSSNSKAIYLELSPGNRVANNYINSNEQGIFLDNSDSNLIEDNIEIKNSREGFFLAFSWGNTLTGNVVYENSKGAFLQGSSYNNITRNTFESGSYGVAMIDYDPSGGPYIPSANNHIFLNNIIQNDVQAGSPSTNTWESPYSINYTWNDNQSSSKLGNYWSDISGKDYDDDGIMDTNGYYINDENKDHYPLTRLWEPYFGFAHNIPPHPSLTYSPSDPMIVNGEADVELDASDSSDPDGSIKSYQWDFGDGETDSGETITHSYQNPGTYTLKLIITDNKGETNKIAKTITIQPPDTTPPTIQNFIPQDGSYVSGSVTISITTNENLDNAILYWDGMSKGMDGSERSWHYTVDDPGEGQHTFYVNVEDLSGNSQDSEERTITIDNTAPTVDFVDPTPADGNSTNKSWVNIRVSSNEELSNAIINWNGVNYTMMGSGNSRYYNMTGLTDGDYTYRVYTYDRAGNSAKTEERSIEMNVASLSDPPIADFSFSPSSPKAGDNITFTDESSDSDADGQIEQWSWDFGDGSSSTNQSPTHKYSSKGNYTVRLTVTDNSGDSNSTTKTIKIAESESSDESSTGGGSGGGGGGGSLGLPPTTSEDDTSPTPTATRLRTPASIPWIPSRTETPEQSAPSIPKSSTPTSATPTQTEESFQGPQGIPGFEAIFAIGGLLTVAYLIRRKR